MRKTSLIIAIVAICLAVSLAQAQDKATKQSQHGPRGNFGLGIIVGEPTGLDMKLYLNEENAIEGAVAWSLEGNNHLHLQAEYLYHNYGLIKVSKGQLPLFFGVGGRIILVEDADDVIGIRFPVGLAYIIEGGILDVFGEIVPIMDLFPDTDFDLEGALGVRFWF